ncbi:phenylalanine--tRNA ligase subunit beta [Candidatus Pacearchaeota archaeon]|nr:phenylalanine--tRNA ligase subunit beta [Candidatus Pacearchaeota archaeon]
MTVITIKKSKIKENVRNKTDEEMDSLLSLFGVGVEEITESNISLDIPPNRPDLLSVPIFLASLRTFIGKENSLKKQKTSKPEKNYKVEIDSSVKEIRPFTVCCIVKNISFDEQKIKEIIDLQEKLHSGIGKNRKKFAVGIYPLEKINFPITYKAEKPEKIKFIPLGSENEMSALEILKKHPSGIEYSDLLSNFKKYPVFIDSKKNILSMPPVINSEETGKITENTKEVFIECSGSDFELLSKVLNILSITLAEMGGKIYAIELEYGKNKLLSPNFKIEEMKVSIENTNSLLGLNLEEAQIGKLLEKMGHEYKNKKVKIPHWRGDILHENDVIEDIAIAYGYQNFSRELPNIFTIGQSSKKEEIKKKISEILIGLGLNEISSYHLIKFHEANASKTEKIEVENSKTDYKSLRNNLLISALRTISQNKDNDYPQQIFEIGTVFSHDKENKTETGIKENESLIILMSPANFTKMKQTSDYLFRLLNVNYKIEESTHLNLIGGRTAKLTINKKEIGYLGELHPETLREWNIKMPCAVIEISLEEIFDILLKKD